MAARVHTVVKGDTLSEIALQYLGDGSKASYMKLAALNNISNPDLIYVGQKIKIDDDGSSSSSSSSSSNSNQPTNVQLGVLSTSADTLVATWEWNKSETESYKVIWSYETAGDNIKFTGENKTITVDEDEPEKSKYCTYGIPSGAKIVYFKVKPISKKKKQNDTEVNYWDANWSNEVSYTDSTPVATPSSGPNVTIDDNHKLTVEIEGLDSSITEVKFQVFKDNTTTVFRTSQKIAVSTGYVAYSCDVDPGSVYKVHYMVYAGSDESDWSPYSPNVGTVPAAPAGITKIEAKSGTSVYLEWAAVNTATSYSIEYSTREDAFDIDPDNVQQGPTTKLTSVIVNLKTGSEYFFRIKATNNEGDSAWSPVSSVILGVEPSAPTTWSSTTTAIVGEDLYLYWVHNAEDGSTQTRAELELITKNGEEVIKNEVIEIDNSEREEEDQEKTSQYEIDTTEYTEGIAIQWRVRTAGVTGGYGDWSVQRTIDIYAKPTIDDFRITDKNENSVDVVKSFPFYVSATPGPKTQTPIGYHLEIVSNSVYESTDSIGNPKTINAGEAVYSKYFDTYRSLLVEFSAGNVDLENNIEYTAKCIVSMNSGLTGEASFIFTVNWVDAEYSPNAEIGLNVDNMTASITPYCENRVVTKRQVNYTNGEYVVTAEDVGSVYGEVIRGARTTTGELVYNGVTAAGTEVYFSNVEETTHITNVYLSVYRREFDGAFTELAKGLDGAKRTTIIDPHPALDYARYRIVAADKSTGAISYYDMPGYAVGGKAAIIQWDEAWTSFETSEESPLEQPAWSGSLLKLPYNIDVSDSHKTDVELIEYIGRSHPVSYYGTHLGQTSSWSMEIVKDDKETLYALRRLAKWMGNVYVREPSGSGYWATVSVSFNLKHKSLTIPVSLSITRVEGGV